MKVRGRLVVLAPALVLCATAVALPPRPAGAVSEAILAVAGPLAEQYGVPASAVTGLLEGGLSLDTVTQLLLVQQSSGSSLDTVTKLFHEQGASVQKAADELGVAQEAYSAENVQKSLADARAKAAASAQDAAADEAEAAAGKALESLGGMLNE